MVFMLIIGAANIVLSIHKDAPHPRFQLIIGIICVTMGLLESIL